MSRWTRPIRKALRGRDARDQQEIDARLIALDGTDNKCRLGANALLAVSMATAHAAAADAGQPLWRYLAHGRRPSMPVPMIILSNHLQSMNYLLACVHCFAAMLLVPDQ